MLTEGIMGWMKKCSRLWVVPQSARIRIAYGRQAGIFFCFCFCFFLMSYKTVFIKEKIGLKQLCSTIFFKRCYLFILFLAAVGFHCFRKAFSRCSKRGLLFVVVLGLLIAVASLVRNSGSTRMISIVVAHSLGCSEPCGIFQGQELNPCPLHWQAGSLPLDHQRSPLFNYFFLKYNLI